MADVINLNEGCSSHFDCLKEEDEDNSEEELYDLLYAARVGDLEEVKRLVELKKVDCASVDINGNSALHLSCANGHLNVVKYLIEKENYLLTLQNKAGNTPLHWAVQTKQKDTVKFIMSLCKEKKEEVKEVEKKEEVKEVEKKEEEEEVKEVEKKEEVKEVEKKEEEVKEAEKKEEEEEVKEVEKKEVEVEGKRESCDYIANSEQENEKPKRKELESCCVEEKKPEIEKGGAQLNVEEDVLVDVLKKNAFGKSILNEVYNLGDEDLLCYVLNHKSACALDQDKETTSKNTNNNSLNHSQNKSILQIKQNINAESQLSPSPSNPAKSKIIDEVFHEFKFYLNKNCDLLQEKNIETNHEAVDIAREEDKCIFILCREIGLSWTGNVFKDVWNSSQDTTGVLLWDASIVASQWIAKLTYQKEFSNKKVMELGSGCGLIGLAACKANLELNEEDKMKKFIFTDNFSFSLHNIAFNLNLNNIDFVMLAKNEQKKKHDNEEYTEIEQHGKKEFKGTEVLVKKADWSDKSTWIKAGKNEINAHESENYELMDVIVGSDLIYDDHMQHCIALFLKTCLNKNSGRFLYAHRHQRRGAANFAECLRQSGFEVSETRAPEEFYKNCLKSKTQDVFDMHFAKMKKKDVFFIEAILK